MAGFWQSQVQAATYVFGIDAPGESYLNANLKSNLQAVARVVEKKNPELKMVVKTYSDGNEFMNAAKRGELAFAFSINEEVMFNLMSLGKYAPLLGYELFNQQRHQYCLYVNKDSNMKSIADLKRKSLATYENEWTWLKLFKIIKAKPENFFGKTKLTPGGLSSAYALSLKQVDVAFIHSFAVYQLERFNPGPLKKIKALYCGEKDYPPPILVLNTVPKVQQEKLLHTMKHQEKDPDFAAFRKITKLLGLKFYKANPANWAPSYKEYQAAKAKGLFKNYQAWLNHVR